MKILVKRDRMDPLVTPEAQSTQAYNSQTTEEQMNSEVELLRSRDLLERVVVECGLQRTSGWEFVGELFDRGRSQPNAERNQIARAAVKLSRELKSDVIKKSNLISVSYRSEDPETAERVLDTLGKFYLAKHIAVHRPPGTAEFFKNETLRYRRLLDEAEARIAEFTRDSSVVSAPVEKDAAIAKSTEFNAVLRQTQAAIAETKRRLQALKANAESTPARMTTQVRSSDDGKLLSDLRSNLLSLEQKRTELLAKFEPGYRPVQQVIAQIAQTRAAIEAAERARLNEEVTDRNPTFDWIKQEQARSEAELAGLEARANATAAAVSSYEASARALEQKELVQADLVRPQKRRRATISYIRRRKKKLECPTRSIRCEFSMSRSPRRRGFRPCRLAEGFRQHFRRPAGLLRERWSCFGGGTARFDVPHSRRIRGVAAVTRSGGDPKWHCAERLNS